MQVFKLYISIFLKKLLREDTQLLQKVITQIEL